MAIVAKKQTARKVVVKGHNSCIDVFVKHRSGALTQVFTCQITFILDQQTKNFNLRAWIDARNTKKFTRIKVINNLFQPSMLIGSMRPYAGSTEPLTVELVNNASGTFAATGASGTAIVVPHNMDEHGGAFKITNFGWIRGGGGNGGKGGTGGRSGPKAYVYYLAKPSTVSHQVPTTTTTHGTKKVVDKHAAWASGHNSIILGKMFPWLFSGVLTIGVIRVAINAGNVTVSMPSQPWITPVRVRMSHALGAPVVAVSFHGARFTFRILTTKFSMNLFKMKYAVEAVISAGSVTTYRNVSTSASHTTYHTVSHTVTHAGAVHGTIAGHAGGGGGAGGVGQWFHHRWTYGHRGSGGGAYTGRGNDILYKKSYKVFNVTNHKGHTSPGITVSGTALPNNKGSFWTGIVIPAFRDAYPVGTPAKYFSSYKGTLTAGTPGFDWAAAQAAKRSYTIGATVFTGMGGRSYVWYKNINSQTSRRYYSYKLKYPSKVRDYKPVNNHGNPGYKGGKGGNGGNWGEAGHNGENGVHGSAGTVGGKAGYAVQGKGFLSDNGAGLVATGTSSQHLSGHVV